ncbi:hypothetical protein LDENG_00213860 [Lucifuga dentata]|nr:hypothetical protein LDENG_00213860 [Lucifuga dentata]
MYFTEFVPISLLTSFHRYPLPQFRCFQCSSYKLELLSNQIFPLCCLWVKQKSGVNPLCCSSKWDYVVDCHIL